MTHDDQPMSPAGWMSPDTTWVHVLGCALAHMSHEGECQVIEPSAEVSGRRPPTAVIAPTVGEVRVRWDALPDPEPVNHYRIVPPPELSEEQARDLIARFEAVSRTSRTTYLPALSEGDWENFVRAEDTAEDRADELRQQEGNWQRAADAVRRHGYAAWNRNGVPMPTDQETNRDVSAGQSPHVTRAEGILTPTDQEEYDLDPGTRRPVQPPVRRPASSAFDSRSPQEVRDEASRRYLGTLRERALASLESDDEARATRMAARRERRTAEARQRSERVQAGTEVSSMYERNLERHRRLQATQRQIATESNWEAHSPSEPRTEVETSSPATSGAEAVRRASEASQAMSESVRRTSAAMEYMADAYGGPVTRPSRRAVRDERFPEPYSNIVDGFTAWCRRCEVYKAKDSTSLCPVCSDDDARTAAERAAGFRKPGKDPSGGIGAV